MKPRGRAILVYAIVVLAAGAGVGIWLASQNKPGHQRLRRHEENVRQLMQPAKSVWCRVFWLKGQMLEPDRCFDLKADAVPRFMAILATADHVESAGIAEEGAACITFESGVYKTICFGGRGAFVMDGTYFILSPDDYEALFDLMASGEPSQPN